MSGTVRFVVCLALSLGVAASASAALVGHWKLDEKSGTIAYDSVGTANGTLLGNPVWAPSDGKIDGALLLDGNGDRVKCSPLTLPANGFSFALWFNPTATLTGATKRMDLVYWATNSRPHLSFNFDGSGTISLHADVGGKKDDMMTTTKVWEAGTWYHLTVTFDGQDFKTYVNGVLEQTVNHPGTQKTATDPIFGSNSGGGNAYAGMLDDYRIYDTAVTAAEIALLMRGDVVPELPIDPSPNDGSTDVSRDTMMYWTPGKMAATHDVYFGTAFADVNAASRTNPLNVLASQSQDVNTFDPGRLQFGQTYYWRVDEVNAAPSYTIFRGKIWSFTVETYSYPLSNVTATASSSDAADMGPEKTVNGSGLNSKDQHSTDPTQMWLSSANGPQPTWIRYTFSKISKLDKMWVWNSNQRLESLLGVGAKTVTIEYSADGQDWKALGDFEFARAPGSDDYAPRTIVDFGGVAATDVRLTFRSNWGGLLPQYGLSEVRFFGVPVSASVPDPVVAATGVGPQPTLSWKPGRQAVSHQVLLGTDPATLAAVATVTEPRYEVNLNLDQTYYWKVIEVNDAENPAAWPSDVWNFSTQKFLVVDDFESYTDEDGKAIWQTWIDGYDVAANGSQVGNANPPYAETKIIHGGKQAMPLFYSNTAGATYSEATRTFDPPQDWTQHGCQSLSLSFYGDPNNSGHMYLKINNTKVPYTGTADDLKKAQWQSWTVPLAATGATLTSVQTLTIGLEGPGVAGVLYIDDLRLYPTTTP